MKPKGELLEALRGLALWPAWGTAYRLTGASNLVVFPDRLQPGSGLTLYDPDGLLSLSLAGSQ